MNLQDSMVFVVDDDEGVRRALTRLIRSAGYDAHCFESATDFLLFYRPGQSAACLILDIDLPGLSGLELQLQLKLNAGNVSLPIVFITGGASIAMTVCAMKEGATDFLTKPVDDTVLLQAIEKALKRSEKAVESRNEIDGIHGRMARLTPREREVLTLLLGGRMNKQVADELGIAEKTIKVHRARVMEKMEARSMIDLVRVADRALVAAPTILSA